jgi:hypothetical protein
VNARTCPSGNLVQPSASWRLVAAVLCVLAAAACGSASGQRPALQRQHQAGRSGSSADPGYQAAREQWIAEGLVFSGAAEAAPLQLLVIDIKQGEVTDRGDTSGYQQIIATIGDLESLPLTDNTRAQLRRGDADVARINQFFHFRQVPSCAIGSGPAGRAAAAQWSKEPRNTTSGIAAGPLRGALADLNEQIRIHPAGTACYPAATADLRSLESATSADIATRGPRWTVYAADIVYLNVFFNQVAGLNGSPNVLMQGTG